MAAQSLVLPSLAPRISSILSKPKTLTLTLTLTLKPSLSSKPSLSACRSFLPSRNGRRSGYGVARYSEVSSELEFEQGEAPAPPPQQQSFSPDLKLYVGNLPFSVDSSELAALFDSVGTVEVVEVIYDKLTGRSRGFGFVTMSSIEEVEAAVEQFNGYELSGRSLRVNSGPPPPRDEFSSRTPQARGSFGSSNRVYVGNLPWSAEDESLGALFSEHGQVIEAKVVYDRETGRSRGFGFVTYSSAAEVDSAISSLDGSDFDGRQIRVSVAEDKPRRF